MSHYVIKLKESWSNYLAELPDYNTPQWQPRDVAKRFASAAAARLYLKSLDARGLDYPGHVVYLRTADDLKAERKALRKVRAAAWQLVDGDEAPPPDTGPLKIEATLHCYQHEIRDLRLALRATPTKGPAK